MTDQLIPGGGTPQTDEELLALYRWSKGDCNRCVGKRLLVTAVAAIETASGGGFLVMACQRCVLHLETLVRMRAEELGQEYVPGLPESGFDRL